MQKRLFFSLIVIGAALGCRPSSDQTKAANPVPDFTVVPTMGPSPGPSPRQRQPSRTAYRVSVVEPDPGYKLMLNTAPDSDADDADNIPPPQSPYVDMAENGVVGLVEWPRAGGRDKIVVIRGAGHRFVLSRPPKPFDNPDDAFHIAVLRLARDGTPFVSLVEHFSGAYLGSHEWVFAWDGKAWIHRVVSFPQRYGGPDNASIGAVSSWAEFAANGDFLDATQRDSDQLAKDPTYQATEYVIQGRGREISSGIGAVTAMRGRYAAGLFAPYGWCSQAGGPTAMRWVGGKEETLGAGVALGVDDNGDAVGDVRGTSSQDSNGSAVGLRDCLSNGKPTLWRHGKVVSLTDVPGSAVAIRNGSIVGTDGVNAFIVDVRGVRPRLRHLADIVQGDWRITNAYAIALDGSILAAGYKGSSKNLDLIVLRVVR